MGFISEKSNAEIAKKEVNTALNEKRAKNNSKKRERDTMKTLKSDRMDKED